MIKNITAHSLGHVTLVLHDIRSVVNVGAIFRTAEAFGVGTVLLSGYTPGPLDRFGRMRSDFRKAALGAEDLMRWERAENPHDVIEKVKKEGRKLMVLEQTPDSVDIRLLRKKITRAPLALVVGNEVLGVDELFLQNADFIVEIPMFGAKESLNVSSATAIALFALF
jgi:tRNA G18 (ribose-2'-O)-methylase SpoU